NMQLVEQIVRLHTSMHMLGATDGQQGIEMARRHRPAVILMDINLPGISGNEALEILKRDPATADIPVIALTANAMVRDVTAGLAAGFYRYITKPVNVEELIEAIQSAVASRSEA